MADAGATSSAAVKPELSAVKDEPRVKDAGKAGPSQPSLKPEPETEHPETTAAGGSAGAIDESLLKVCLLACWGNVSLVHQHGRASAGILL